MSYHGNSDGPYVDKGALRAMFIAGFLFVALVIAYFSITCSGPTYNDRLAAAESNIKLELHYSIYNYSYDNSDGVISLKIWNTGVVSTAKKAAEGDAEALKSWEQLKSATLHYSDYIFDELESHEITGLNVVVMLVNESNHDLKLLTYKNGALVYDVTEGG